MKYRMVTQLQVPQLELTHHGAGIVLPYVRQIYVQAFMGRKIFHPANYQDMVHGRLTIGWCIKCAVGMHILFLPA